MIFSDHSNRNHIYFLCFNDASYNHNRLVLTVDGAAAQGPPNWPCHVPYPCTTSDLFGVIGDCTKFLVCGPGGRHLFTQSCPGGLHFDIRNGECQYPFEAECQRNCSEIETTTVEMTTQTPTTTTKPATTTGNVIRSTV